MSTQRLFGSLILVSLLVLALTSGFASFAPGRETLVMAHNTFIESGKGSDRFDRALSIGMPLAMEVDLIWAPNPKTGKPGSLVADLPERRFNEITGNEPQLKPFFFERIRPVVEKALKENNKANWPLIRLYLDIKNDPPEQLEFVSSLLHEYEGWLTSAVKTKDATQQSPLDLKPLMVMIEDKDNDIKEEYFYNRVPVGGKVLAFGTVKVTMPRGDGLTGRQISDLRFAMKPEELITERASNWRRWWSCSWNYVEPGAKDAAGAWTPEKEARLNAILKRAHGMGYLVSFWNLNGTETGNSEKMGWNPGYNFGSKEAAMVRWQAVAKAGADFIGTDQYEDVSKAIKAGRKSE